LARDFIIVYNFKLISSKNGATTKKLFLKQYFKILKLILRHWLLFLNEQILRAIFLAIWTAVVMELFARLPLERTA